MDTTDRRKEWKCYELLHAGEGPRGRSVDVMLPHYAAPREAAEEAADYFEDLDMIESGYGATEADGTDRYIEVEGAGSFMVVCEVVRKYHAESMKETP